ncbi:MAG: TetR family transcriptional regulator C-terminal domain-containing protein [Robiginitalea sp.]|uniref:TetR family transcriptional regulator C-terminal domain-containing protein n=1 Tax=Robiginitalea sp. TaxID=1902411 RepID=UPI003C722736
MSAKRKVAKPNKKSLITAFMTQTLEAERFPVSVFKFCKENDIEEADFYALFGSMESLQKEIWVFFFEETMRLLEKDAAYAGYGNRERMLSFYFTFFELLGLNRSYILFALSQSSQTMEQLGQLKGLRKSIKIFSRDLIEDANAEKNLKITRHNPDIFSEGAWLQLAFLLRFWIRDDSPGFEKTDVAIEKSVNTIFDIFDNTPMERVLDFGKFLFKEHFA